MSVSPWFDYNAYMTNKLAQLKAAEPDANWTMDNVAAAFAANGYIGIEGAERHFMDFGQNEDVAPNAFFNPTEYYRAKAAHAYGKDVKAVTDADAALVKAAIKGLGMNAWSHYDTFGSSEKVNPSNQFDTEKYMIAKKDALNSIEGGKQYTIDEVYAAFKAAGVSALEHFMTFGGNGAGEVLQKYEGSIPEAFSVPEEKKVNAGGGSEGTNYVLTTGVDTFTGTTNDDSFVAGVVNGMKTLTGGDNLDGGAGRDTLKVFGDAGTFSGVTVKNVEAFEFNGALSAFGTMPATFNASQYAGLDTINLTNAGKFDDVLTFSNLADKFTVGFNGATSVDTPGSDGFVLKYVDAATTANLTTADLSGYVVAGIDGKNIATLNIKGGMAADENTAGLIINGNGLTDANTTIKTVNIESTGGQYELKGSKIAEVNGSASTGDLWIDLTASAGANTAKVIKGGAGNDDVWMLAADVNKGDTIDLGAGDEDMIGFNMASTDTAVTANQYGVIKAAKAETVGFFVGNAAFAVDADKIGGKDLYFNAASATNPEITVNKISSEQTITSGLQNQNASNGMVIISDEGTLGTVNVVLETKGDVLKIDGTAGGSAFGTLNLSGAGSAVVNNSTAGVKINGKDMTGALEATGSTAKDYLTGGAGNDTLISAGGDDVLTGNGGKDTFNVSGSKAAATTMTSVKDNMATITDYSVSDKDAITFLNNTTSAVLTKHSSVNGTVIADDKVDALLESLVVNGTANTTYFWTKDATYIVVNGDSGTSNPTTSDQVVKLIGQIDFTDATYVANSASVATITWGA